MKNNNSIGRDKEKMSFPDKALSLVRIWNFRKLYFSNKTQSAIAYEGDQHHG